MSTTEKVFSRERFAIWIVSLATLLGSLFLPKEALGRHQPVPVTVLVFNYSAASPSTVRTAEQHVSRIFRAAGLQPSWIWCPVPLSAASKQACAAEVGLQSVRVRIVDHSESNYFGEDIFGFAIAPAIATVYYGNAMALAKSDQADYEVPVILGCAIAHEIGHLLLGPGSHARTGIMQAQWKREELERAVKGQQLFTAEEAEKMRCNAASRL